jgi:hypothetical protein
MRYIGVQSFVNTQYYICSILTMNPTQCWFFTNNEHGFSLPNPNIRWAYLNTDDIKINDLMNFNISSMCRSITIIYNANSKLLFQYFLKYDGNLLKVACKPR